MSKFIMTATEVAVNAAINALGSAQSSLEAVIKSCGELSSPEAKQSDKNKAYFSDQADVYREALAVLQRIRASILTFK